MNKRELNTKALILLGEIENVFKEVGKVFLGEIPQVADFDKQYYLEKIIKLKQELDIVNRQLKREELNENEKTTRKRDT